MFNTAFKFSEQRESLLDKDIWTAKDLGINAHHTASTSKLNFTKIKPQWLSLAVKQFIRLQSSVRTFCTCRAYITALINFSIFINEKSTVKVPSGINRRIVVDFICYINGLHFKPASKRSILINLRTFLETAANEQWLPISKERMIFDADLPYLPEPTPRFIPETVMAQLEKRIHTLKSPLDILIRVLMETGRRISEICTLPYDSLSFDQEGDPFITVADAKTKKQHTIPISKELSNTIEQHQKSMQRFNLQYYGVMFHNFRNKNNNCYTALTINFTLNQLAKKYNIVDPNGSIWHFTSHQFRHTVGTRMINSGVSQHLVQHYLGHESPEMTARYARIHDKTMKNAFQSFQKRMVDVKGEEINTGINSLDAQWLKKNILTQALPNGFCQLPLQQQRCPHANACLTCTHFCTSKTFLPQHEQHLSETMTLIDKARSNGWQRQAEMNEAVKDNLINIISRLKDE